MLTHFMDYYSPFWGPKVICMVVEPKARLRVGHQKSQFWPILTRFVDYYSPFWGPKPICMVVEPKARLRVGHQQSQFWPILARFMDYYSPIWAPRAISMTYEPWGAYTCRSSIILGLSDSGLFHGVLLTILGSQSYFHGCRTQDVLLCWSSRLAVWADSDPFLGLYLSFGVPE